MKRMLINATQAEELRVAMVDGQKLYDLDIEVLGREQKKANVYKGKITRIEPSLEAAFVDYGAERHGFLPLKEISREYFPNNADVRGRPNIKDVVKEGQELIIQIEKEERGNKGAALTTFISLAGSYLVLMPNNPRAGGISRRIDGDERDSLRDSLKKLNLPQGMGLIVRTAGVGRSDDELEYDLTSLLNSWNAIKAAADANPAPLFIFQESDVVNRAIRDYLRPDIGEIIIDAKGAYDRTRQAITQTRPAYVDKVKLYQDELPLFNRYQVETQIETAFQREVRLPSGGSVVIDPTEALISIDINSARATKGQDIEETALNTNKEAAQEIARQLRLRDIGGLIVIDFIDMTNNKNQREVENVLKEALQMDRARVQIGRISRFGLLEMSRQRLRPSLGESSQLPCPRCNGYGSIRSVESLALSILRLIEEEAMKDSTSYIQANLPVDAATFLLNEKRKMVAAIEKRQHTQVVIIPNPNMETPHYEVKRIRKSDAQPDQASYELTTGQESDLNFEVSTIERDVPAAPAVQAVVNTQPAPAPAPQARKEKEEKKPGLIKRIIQALFGPSEEEKKKASNQNRKRNQRGNRSKQQNRNRRSTGNRPQNKGQRNQSAKDNRGNDTRGTDNRGNREPQNKRNDNRADKSRNDNTRNENRTDNKRQRKDEGKSRNNQARGQKRGQSRQEKTEDKPRSQRQSRLERQVQNQSGGQDNTVVATTPEQKPVAQPQPASPVTPDTSVAMEGATPQAESVKTTENTNPVEKTQAVTPKAQADADVAGSDTNTNQSGEREQNETKRNENKVSNLPASKQSPSNEASEKSQPQQEAQLQGFDAKPAEEESASVVSATTESPKAVLQPTETANTTEPAPSATSKASAKVTPIDNAEGFVSKSERESRNQENGEARSQDAGGSSTAPVAKPKMEAEPDVVVELPKMPQYSAINLDPAKAASIKHHSGNQSSSPASKPVIADE